MFRHSFSLLFSLIGPVVVAAPAIQAKAIKPAYFLLAGDSTTATQSADGGGWGDGFLNYTLASSSTGHNYGHDGATTASFRAGGDWATVLSGVQSFKSEYTVYVAIQFGHNDQKNTSGVTLAQYQQNLQNFATEATSAGATPILVTPLTRRSFTGTPPAIIENLAPQRNLTITAAQAVGARYIDLNFNSTRYCNAIGPTDSYTYNLNPTDFTHLNVHGSVVFGRMVSDLMIAKFDDVAAVTKPNATLSEELKDLVYA